MDSIRKINYIFDKKQKQDLAGLVVLILIGSCLELLGVSVVLPVINAIMYPQKMLDTWYLKRIYEILHLTSTTQLTIILLGALILTYIVKNTFLIFMYRSQYKFIYNNLRVLSGRMMKCYLNQSYIYHVSKSSAELLRNINSDTAMFFGFLIGVIQLFTELSVCGMIFVYLLIKDKTITMSILILMIVLMILFFKVYKKYLYRIGDKNRYYQMSLNKWVQQAFGGIKETKVLNKEKFFYEEYDKTFVKHAKAEYDYHTMIVIPKPIIETICISGLLGAIAIKVLIGNNITYFLPIISIFAVAAFRMLPSFNRITEYMGNIIFNKSAVDMIYHDLLEIDELNKKINQKVTDKEDIKMEKGICIKDLYFKYPNTEQYVIENINMIIPKNSSVAFIGPSGAGKTTLADIILGILSPTKGVIMVDDLDIFDNLDGWHRFIGYIPQNIYLLDDTIRHNVAFGIPEDEIDDEKVAQAIEKAQMTQFINELEKGLETEIGERGVRLSGGQRQRIGIARALYYEPDILVLDEATSALDNETEKAVMEAIDSLHGDKTLIIIAHRLSTIKNCDYIYELKDKVALLQDNIE